MVRRYLRDLNDHKIPMKLTDKVINDETKFGVWKIQLIMLNNCTSSKKFEETCPIYSANVPVEILMGSDTDDIIEELFETILQRFEEARETSNKKRSEFIHESVELLYYYFHKIDMKRGESYIESSKWLKNKKATINPKNENVDNCFQYAITVALNHENIKNKHQRVSNIGPYISQYNWKGFKFPSRQKDWKNFEQNNKTIALNILEVPHKSKTITRTYKSKYNNEPKNQVILLMITDGKKWHYLAIKSECMFYNEKWCNCPVKSLSRLLRTMTSNHHGDSYCLNCLNYSCSTDNRLKKHEELCNKHGCCHIEMPR